MAEWEEHTWLNEANVYASGIVNLVVAYISNVVAQIVAADLARMARTMVRYIGAKGAGYRCDQDDRGCLQSAVGCWNE